MKTLKSGSRGAMVGVLQDMLTRCGETPGKIDGAFGKNTLAAVKSFQKKKRIKVDGVAGLATFEQLYMQTGDVPCSPHFDFKKEIDRPHRADKAKYYKPMPKLYYANAQELFFDLEEIRAELNRLYHGNGEIVLITRSGYRGKEYNKAVGGAGGSKHLTGEAVDFYAKRGGVSFVPNCYQIGRVMEKMNRGGTGYGSNNNVHYDIRQGRTRWWYSYKNWTAWERNQGKRA